MYILILIYHNKYNNKFNKYKFKFRKVSYIHLLKRKLIDFEKRKLYS